MRVSREAMARHRREIVAASARMLRERGIAATSVADLMQAAGLTHGGFYRHFPSKEALVAESVAAAFGGIRTGLEDGASALGLPAAVATYIEQYLSRRHVSKPGYGCPMAALGVEAAREGAPLQKVFTEGTLALLESLSAVENGSPEERRRKALKTFAMLVGAVVVARAVGDVELGDEILAACRDGGRVAKRGKYQPRGKK